MISKEYIKNICLNNELLGHGNTSSVYAIDWHSTRAVIKIITGCNNQNELHVCRELMRQKATAPRRVGDFWPNVFEAGILDEGTSYIIMERLSELSSDNAELLFAPLYSRTKKAKTELLANKLLLNQIASRVVNAINGANSSEIADLAMQSFVDYYRFSKLPETYDGKAVERICESAARCARAHGFSIAPNNLTCAVNNVLALVCGLCSLPADTKSFSLQDSAGHEARQALYWMAQRGIKWADIHEGNLMQRGNQLVFIDFGEYKLAA